MDKNKIVSLVGLFGFVLGSLFLYTGCNGGKTEEITTVETFANEEELREKAELFFRTSVKDAIDPTISPEKVELGMMLYYDTRLSLEGNISCNSCHDLKRYGVDNLALSPGDTKELGGRNSPTNLYAFLHTMQFWDGRAKDVEEQAGGPILNPVEHNIPSEEFLEERLRAVEEYQEFFAKVYPDAQEPITYANITDAIGAFERQLAPMSRFDDWMEGDITALTNDEKRGMMTFVDKGCVTCHNGIALGGSMFQKFGANDKNYWEFTKSANIDEGRFEVTGLEKDKYLFKVPGLRNIEMTYPYFHDGSVEKLEDAVRIMGQLQVANELTEDEIKDITTFLKSLTADVDDKYKQ